MDAGGPDEARQAFAGRWADAVAGTSYVALTPRELVAVLDGLTARLLAALHAPRHAAAAAAQVGADLVAAHFTGTDTLSTSLGLLAAGLPALHGDPAGDEPGRIGALLGDVAAGYAAALRDRAVAEQEAIRQAMLAARRESERRLAISESRFRAMFTDAAVGIGIGDLDGRIQHVNPALRRMFGYSVAEFTTHSVGDMVHPEDGAEVWPLYQQLVRGDIDHFSVEKRFHRKDGVSIWTNLTVSLVRDADGAPSFQVAMLEDVSDRHRLQASLAHLAYHDPLTHLPNRTQFSERLAQVFTEPADGARVGLCFLDLDGFKRVNDSLGHDVGDHLLTAVAARLAGCCGPEHLLARMGGDEFVVLLADSPGPEPMIALADAFLAALAPPVRIDGHELSVRASIGVVELPVAETAPAQLMSAADITLYRAKHDGKGRYAVHDRHRTDREIMRHTLAAGLPAALARGEFVLHYQPIVTLSDQKLRGVEALVRWAHPEYGLLPPDRFVGPAEETGAIAALGRWVLAQACHQARSWYDRFGGTRAPFVSVNLSPRQLEDPHLVDDIEAILHVSGLDPALLQLELTEQALLGDEPGAVAALQALHDGGIRIAVDDFGTGYSSLSYLPRLPVHALKLDGSFVTKLDGGVGTEDLLVATIVGLAHGLGLSVTAEGIETLAQLDRLCALDCDLGQGWYFAKAEAPETITALLDRTVAQHTARDASPP